jgi:hypothetical protein
MVTCWHRLDPILGKFRPGKLIQYTLFLEKNAQTGIHVGEFRQNRCSDLPHSATLDTGKPQEGSLTTTNFTLSVFEKFRRENRAKDGTEPYQDRKFVRKTSSRRLARKTMGPTIP